MPQPKALKSPETLNCLALDPKYPKASAEASTPNKV